MLFLAKRILTIWDFFRVMYKENGLMMGCMVSKFLFQSDPEKAIKIGLKNYPNLLGKAIVQEVTKP